MRAIAFIPVVVLSVLIWQQKPHTVQNDGPYVFCKNKQIYVTYIHDEHGTKTAKTDSFPVAEKGNIVLKVATDIPGQTFTVKLKTSLETERTEYKDIKKQFVVSDIEGNFKAFRTLLQAHNIIDSAYNWTFGNGHLVLTGDFFDRGTQVTEVLWLIYSLEEKAKAAGGYVHFILGNHEIMNMNNDLRYVHSKYIQNAGLMTENYMDLFGTQAELGQWLRTKNVMETVGHVLYVHGGISQLVNSLDLSAQKINKMVRPFYADTTFEYTDTKTEVLYSNYGPFWYRGYYEASNKATEAQVDSTLSIYRVKHIATGHTVIADTISSVFNGKVFNTDVHHAKGISEALFIHEGKFYRATASGEKHLIAK
jgi:Calcineurin-like phosphoesterase